MGRDEVETGVQPSRGVKETAGYGPMRRAVVVALIGAVLVSLTAWWLWERAERETELAVASEGEVVADDVGRAMARMAERLMAVGGLFQASEEVTQEEFRRFVANFEPTPGVGGMGYMPIVEGDDLGEFVAQMRETIPGYEVFELNTDGNRTPVGTRTEHVPLQWFEPADAFGRPHGFDSMSEPQRRATLERARSSREFSLTPFLELVSEDEADGFVAYWPVTDPGNSVVVGFTVAPLDLSELLDARIPEALSDDVAWSVTDLDASSRIGTAEPTGWSQVLDVGGRRWLLTVTPTEDSSLAPDRTEPALVLLAGLAASALAAGGVYLHQGRTRARQELERLREVTRAKDQFLASVSHELRTPLTGVLGFAELLRDDHDVLDEDQRRTMIRSVAEEATDLSHIIDDLLVSARSELDVLMVTRVQVSARAQVAQVLETCEDGIRDRVEILGDADDVYTMLGDPARVRQILRNLLSNAYRYGGNRIQIRFSAGAEAVHVEVADDGPGLPPAEWERIFEPYHRVHDQEGQPEALGIGLSVARHLARLMRGDLTYRREAEWSVLDLTLPAADTSETDQPTSDRVSAQPA